MEKSNSSNSNPFLNIINLSKQKYPSYPSAVPFQTKPNNSQHKRIQITPVKAQNNKNVTPKRIAHIIKNKSNNKSKKHLHNISNNKLIVNDEVNKNETLNVNNILPSTNENNNNNNINNNVIVDAKSEVNEIQRLKKLLEEKEHELTKAKNQVNDLLKENITLKTKVAKYKERLDNMANDVNFMSKETLIYNYFLGMNEEMLLQGNVVPNLDEMTYEELLALEDKIGYVCKGLKKELINKLPKKEYNKPDDKNENDNCVICQCDINQGDTIIELNCGHFYHCACIEEWLLKEKNCPFCKVEVFVSESARSAVK